MTTFDTRIKPLVSTQPVVEEETTKVVDLLQGSIDGVFYTPETKEVLESTPEYSSIEEINTSFTPPPATVPAPLPQTTTTTLPSRKTPPPPVFTPTPEQPIPPPPIPPPLPVFAPTPEFQEKKAEERQENFEEAVKSYAGIEPSIQRDVVIGDVGTSQGEGFTYLGQITADGEVKKLYARKGLGINTIEEGISFYQKQTQDYNKDILAFNERLDEGVTKYATIFGGQVSSILTSDEDYPQPPTELEKFGSFVKETGFRNILGTAGAIVAGGVGYLVGGGVGTVVDLGITFDEAGIKYDYYDGGILGAMQELNDKKNNDSKQFSMGYVTTGLIQGTMNVDIATGFVKALPYVASAYGLTTGIIKGYNKVYANDFEETFVRNYPTTNIIIDERMIDDKHINKNKKEIIDDVIFGLPKINEYGNTDEYANAGSNTYVDENEVVFPTIPITPDINIEVDEFVYPYMTPTVNELKTVDMFDYSNYSPYKLATIGAIAFGLPKLKSKGLQVRELDLRKSSQRSFKYSPSLSAKVFNITTKRLPKQKVFTGQEIRPVLKTRKGSDRLPSGFKVLSFKKDRFKTPSLSVRKFKEPKSFGRLRFPNFNSKKSKKFKDVKYI